MNTLEQLQSLSTAEDFFTTLNVPFDEAVVRVARLHILRRMGQYIMGTDWTGLDDDAVKDLCRSYLEQAYADFVTSSPIEARLFKVHQDAVRPKPEAAKPFVPLTALGVAP